MAIGDDPTAPLEPVREDTSVYVRDIEAGPVPPPRRGVSPLTIALAVLLIGGAGFIGGVRVQKSRASASTGAEAVGGESGGAGHGGGTGAGDAFAREGAGGAGTAVGQVRLVDGTTIYLADAQGNIVKVTTGPGAVFTKTAPASIADVRPGDSVVIRGQARPDGTITASRVADSGAGGGAGEG